MSFMKIQRYRVFNFIHLKCFSTNFLKSNVQEPESLELVAKLPVENPVLRVVFQPEMTFIKENNFYREIYPTILKFQRSRIVPKQYLFDVFATCCGVRNALHEDEIHYDDDAVLILENLYAIGYEIGDRLKGFSKEKALFILEVLLRLNEYFNSMKFNCFIPI